ncbi:hypothetical protein HMPREF9402_2866 [Turicibacter sp. HGF1]|nr:hypothetical protein HMPREF9402_2866 [Turicibacter sp. HGF1]
MMETLNKPQELMGIIDLDFDTMDVDFNFDEVASELEEEEKETSYSNGDEQSSVDGIFGEAEAEAEAEAVEEDEEDRPIEAEDEFDLTGFTTVSSTNNSTHSVGARGRGGLSIINSENNGKRITLTKKWWIELGQPQTIQFAMHNHTLVVGECLGDQFPSFSWITKDQKPVLYHSALVKELVNYYQLDYSNGRTSLSFGEIQLKKINGKPALIIQMK